MINIYYFITKQVDKMKYSIIMCLYLSVVLFGQNIEVPLDSLSVLDDGDFHIELFSDAPKEKLIHPKFDLQTVKYFSLFYSWKTSNDQDISVLVDQQQDRDILYVDRNNDEDLTNDGKPIIFLHSKNKQYIDIKSESDPKQIVRLVIYRIPPIVDSIRQKYFDNSGNLNPSFAKNWGGMKGVINYKGERGTFFCDDRVTLCRGKVELDGIKYNIGLFDYSNNGLYNDDDDVLLIDLNKDGKLTYFDPNEVFKLNDVFKNGGSNYELTYVDKYGKKLIIEKTSQNPTNYFLQNIQNQSSQFQQKNSINPKFWEISLKSIEGNKVAIADYKGKYIFLNIWGEWCLPCLKEIPELKKDFDHWKDKVVFLSIIKIQDINKAKSIISKEKIEWPQLPMTSEIENGLKINGFPTNILIYPDGKTFLKEGQINRTFFEINIK
ncbi:MAG: TlpA family protein disulfide reductase [Ignavibacteriales bacterium]|nr:TlpA family protein disulfide reductase [Ignavibacteriales bacterium]